MNEIIKQIVLWYNQSKRDLPWRKTVNPYNIWVSEIILQQTKVEQGLPYYLKFIESFPDIEKLAKANLKDVLNIWKGLGYYRRALYMHQAAQYVFNKCCGKFPDNYYELLKLKGIGEYTAAAIASIAYGDKTPVVDGNVIRVMSRVFLLDGDKNNKKFKNLIIEKIKPTMEFFNPSEVNQGLMELGALICLPFKPTCLQCPIRQFCKAYIENKVENYPSVCEKSKPTTIYFNYIVMTDYRNVFMQQRAENDIWKNLYQFPLIEAHKNFSYKELAENEFFKILFPKTMILLKESNIFKHTLSHRIIFAKYFIFKIKKGMKIGFEKIKMNELENLPLPRLIEKIKNDVFAFLKEK